MKINLEWLKRYTRNIENLDEKLNLYSGIELEGVSSTTAHLSTFIIAKIIKVAPHPNSQKLKICQVDVGKSNLVQVICGASNARENIIVVFADVGTHIPRDNIIIKNAMIMGVESLGMLCSSQELCISRDMFIDQATMIDIPDGIIELNTKAHIGAMLDTILNRDYILDVKITPNRGDCLSAIGIARELGLHSNITEYYMYPQVQKSDIVYDNINTSQCFYTAIIEDADKYCAPEYVLRYLSVLNIKKSHPLLDVADFIMQDIGQPLHIYDRDTIRGRICLRYAYDNEEFLALNGKNYLLSSDIFVLADDIGVIGVPGVIGGLRTMLTHNTKVALIESACFDPKSVSIAGIKMNLSTDARYRFERGVDPCIAPYALSLFADKIYEHWQKQSAKESVTLDQKVIDKIIGIPGFDAKIIRNVGFHIKDNDILVPSWRYDISNIYDIIEEITRLHGYDMIPSKSFFTGVINAVPENKNYSLLSLSMYKKLLCARGLYELCSLTLCKESEAKIFDDNVLSIANPISQDASVLRTSLLVSLLSSVKLNQKRFCNNICLFEVGAVFNIEQSQRIAFVRYGVKNDVSWIDSKHSYDIFDIKADLETIMDCQYNLITKDLPSFCHPYQSGWIKIDESIIGLIGAIHPVTLDRLDLKGPIYFCEIYDINCLVKHGKKDLVISPYNNVVRDFAFIVDQGLQYSEFKKALLTGLDIYKDSYGLELNLFDCYSVDDKKSFGIRITIVPYNSTMKEHEINNLSNVVIAIGEQYGVLRKNF